MQTMLCVNMNRENECPARLFYFSSFFHFFFNNNIHIIWKAVAGGIHYFTFTCVWDKTCIIAIYVKLDHSNKACERKRTHEKWLLCHEIARKMIIWHFLGGNWKRYTSSVFLSYAFEKNGQHLGPHTDSSCLMMTSCFDYIFFCVFLLNFILKKPPLYNLSHKKK